MTTAPAPASGWGAYLSANPDLQTYWNSLSASDKAQFGNDPNQFAQYNYETQGQAQGRPGAPTAPAAAAPTVQQQVDSGPLAGIAVDQRDVSNQYTGAQAAQAAQSSANQYNDANAQAGSSYSGQLGLLNEDYAKAQGMTADEIAAWDAKAQDQKGIAENLAASRFGVNGLYGSAVRNVAQVGQQYAEDRAITQGDLNRTDYNNFSTGRYAAYGDLANRQNTNVNDYYTRNNANDATMWAGYQGNQANYSAGRGSAYSDWLNAQNNASSRGFDASQLAVNAGQTAVTNSNASRQNAADAYSQGQVANANIWGNVANNLGSAYGAWAQQQKPATNPYSYAKGG